MKKKIDISLVLVFIIFIGTIIFYFTYYKVDKTETTSYADDNIYTANDFKNSGLEPEELDRLINRLNKTYVLLEEKNNPYSSWIDIGMYKKVLGDYKGAEEAWMNAVTLTDRPDLAYGNLANIYFYNIKNYDLAEEYYQKAIEISVNPFTYREGLSDLYRYIKTDKKDLIEKNMLDGALSDPNRKLKYFEYLYYYFVDEKNIDKEAEYLKKIKEVNPEWKSDIQDVNL